VTEEELVSSDIIGSPYSALVDLQLTMVFGERMVKVLAWYDNEWGYSRRIVDMAAYMARRTPERAPA
jgi:glyceraldehyde 3-phosphate dehydrogenase